MTIEVNGKKCRCGNEGCWELYASEQALLHDAHHLDTNISENEEITLEFLNQLAENNDAAVLELFDKVGGYLGVGINNIINIFNTQKVIIGNRLASSEKWLKEALRRKTNNQNLWFHQEDLQINFSELSTHSTALGVAAFSVEKFLASDVRKRSI